MKNNDFVIRALKSLENSSLKVTSQRKKLIKLLFSHGNAHFSVEQIYKIAQKQDLKISLATIYNSLNQFTKNGIIKSIKVSRDKIYFDTNLEDHHHFYSKSSEELTDIKSSSIVISKLPNIPKGKKLGSVDVIVNLDDL